MRRIMEVASEVAFQSDYGKYRFGAVVLSGSRILAVGSNSQKTHPNGAGPFMGVHAEHQALSVAEAKVGDLNGATIAVARVGIFGSNRPSFPCPACINMILEKGIRRILYHNHEAEIRQVDTRNI